DVCCVAFDFYLDEVMTVEPIGGVKGQEGSHSDDQGSQSRVADIKVVVGKAAAAFAQDLVIRVSGGELGLSRPQRRSLLHALEDEVDPIALGSFHAAQPRLAKLFLFNAPLRPLHGNVMVSGKAFAPALVVVSPLHQNLFGNQRNTHDFVKEVNHVLGTRQHRKIAPNHDTVEAVINNTIRLPYRRINVSMGHPLPAWCEAHNMIRLIAHDQTQKNFKYLWLDFRSGIKLRAAHRASLISLMRLEHDLYAPVFLVEESLICRGRIFQREAGGEHAA